MSLQSHSGVCMSFAFLLLHRHLDLQHNMGSKQVHKHNNTSNRHTINPCSRCAVSITCVVFTYRSADDVSTYSTCIDFQFSQLLFLLSWLIVFLLCNRSAVSAWLSSAGCYSLCWPVMIHVGWCCVLVAQQTGTVGIQPKRWLQRCTSAPSSNEATSSKKWSLSVRIAASWASVFLQKLLFDFYLSFRFFYYCILILHRFSFILWILINTLQNDNKPSWILKYLHKCKIQKVRWNWILQMVLETTMMQDKKQAGSKNWNMARKPTKRQTLNRKTSTEGGAKCNITNGHAHCDATWLASCAMTPQAQHFPHDGDWNCVLIG